MIKTIHFSKDGAKRVDLDAQIRGGFLWIDCSNPTKDELRTISKKYGIRRSVLDDALDKHERARVHSVENHHAIIYKVPHSNEELRTDSIGLFWAGNTIITVHKEVIKDIFDVLEYSKEISKPLEFIHILLEGFTNSFFQVLESIDGRIEKLEKKVVRSITKVHTKEILSLKKTLIYFHKSLIANREVLVSVKEGQVFVLSKKESIGFSDIYNDVMQLIDLTGIHSEVLSSIMKTDATMTSNALGDIMKRLTVFASFALVPTLIASVYGMNFRPDSPWSMPELDWYLGYPFSLALMAASVLGMYFYFKKENWI